MATYLIAFNDEWTPDLEMDELRDRGVRGRAVIKEMTDQGVFIFSDGALDATTALCSVVPNDRDRDGDPVFTDGPFVETKEHLGGLCIIEVDDDEQARYWAGRVAVAVGWPQELHKFPHRLRMTDGEG